MATGVRGYLNNYSTTLDGAITNSATTINVQAGQGAAINTELSTSDYVALTIADGTNTEIVHCTSVSTDTLTVERGQEGTSGTAFDDDDVIEVRPTAASLLNPMWEVVEVRTLGSASATVDFDISDGGDYRITVIKAQQSATADWRVTVFTSGPTEQTTNYEYTNANHDSNIGGLGAVDLTNSTSAAFILIAEAVVSNSAYSLTGELEFAAKDAAKNFHCTYEFGFEIASGYIAETEGKGMWKDTSNTLVQLRIAVSTGTISTGAKFLVERRRF